jgi:hypothetical protein
MDSQRIDDLKRLYSAIDRLRHRVVGERKLAGCNGRLSWPQRGVIFLWKTARSGPIQA